MKEKILYIVVIIVFIIALVITAIFGLDVDLNYAEGNTITFTVGKSITTEEIKDIAQEVFGKNKVLVQEVELFGDSALIKTREDVTDEKLGLICSKINEKYSVELEIGDFAVDHIPNTKLRNVIEPYIIPIGLSTLLILGFYAIRYKGAKKMFDIIKFLIIAEGLLYSLYAIGRIKVNEITMPIALTVYALVILIYTTICELKNDNIEKKGK